MDRSQAMYDMALKQGMGAMTDPEASEALADDAEERGAAAALADAVDRCLEGVASAAGAAGAELPPEVMEAVAGTMVLAMAQALVEADAADDPEALAVEVMQILGLGAPQGEPDEGNGQPGALRAVQ